MKDNFINVVRKLNLIDNLHKSHIPLIYKRKIIYRINKQHNLLCK